MNQSFDIKELKKLCKQNEHIDSSLQIELETACQNISNETFDFDLKQVGNYYLANDLPNKLILRKLNDNIKRIYKDEQANRKTIVSQIKTLMEETCPSWIIKTDIKSFYESIDRERLLAKFKDDSILSYYSLLSLDKLFSNNTLQNSTGVPRGMNISATLSEIYMRKFDKWVRNYPSVFYYARFVDDIIIFTYTKQGALSLLKSINEKLKELAEGLVINDRKTQLFDGLALESLNITDGTKIKKDNFLEYLGYKFAKKNNKKNVLLEISIAEKKIKKIKSRITWSFADYTKNCNFELLENRIKFLTGNYSIKKNAEGNDLRAGIFFNYSQLNNFDVLNELNTYYKKILFSKKGNLGTQIDCLSMTQKNTLKKYCFVTGFKNKIYNSFDSTQMSEIVSCWK
jgi:hypothetical protein